jgi:hypothetical protein
MKEIINQIKVVFSLRIDQLNTTALMLQIGQNRN